MKDVLCDLIFKRQHSQEEHRQWQTSLANTNNNFTNPTNLAVLSSAHEINIGIYYFAHFHLHSPTSISPETPQFTDFFFFSLLKSYC